MKRALLTIALALLLLVPAAIIAQWTDPGVPVCTAVFNQSFPEIIKDGAGGAIITWHDERNGSLDIYAQRIDPWGRQIWTTDGLPLCTDGTSQWRPSLAPDGHGGAIVLWQDGRGGPLSSDLYAQRVDAQGNPLWAHDGVPVCTAPNGQWHERMVPDGNGGVIIAWEDRRVGEQVFAQRLDASGTPLWAANGVVITPDTLLSGWPVMATDGLGGAVIAWKDETGPEDHVYAQRVNPDGLLLWPSPSAPAPLPVCTLSSAADYFDIASDVAFYGVVIAWSDGRDYATNGWDIYAQHLSEYGTAWWTDGGIPVCDAPESQGVPFVAPDGIGGVYLAWDDWRGGQPQVYAQRMSAGGAAQWTTNGVAAGPLVNQQYTSDICGDTSGVIVTWYDLDLTQEDIFLQRLAASDGALLWGEAGIEIAPHPGIQTYGRTIVEDDYVIVTWQDDRDNYQEDIYAQRIDLESTRLGNPLPLISSVLDVPGDQGGQVTVNWFASDWDNTEYQMVQHYSLWRAVEEISAVSEPAKIDEVLPHLEGIPIIDPAEIGPDFEGPALAVLGDYFWQWIVDLPAFYQAGYSYACPTLNDSTGVDDGIHYFKVIAHGFGQLEFWESPPDSGYSTDDFAPAAPSALTATRVATDVELMWQPGGQSEPDFAQYAIYRSETSGVTPVPGNFLAFAPDTTHLDTTADPAKAYYYVVTATDVHGNESNPSNEAMADVVSGIDARAAVPSALTVLPNYPNPFGAHTEFRIGLPSPGNVRIDVYDVAGRRVATRRVMGVRGWQVFAFDAKELANGAYFYRVEAAGRTVTRKMIVTR